MKKILTNIITWIENHRNDYTNEIIDGKIEEAKNITEADPVYVAERDDIVQSLLERSNSLIA